MSKEISDEIKKQGQAAYDNYTDYYVCKATGNTYPVKNDLQRWGFFWKPEEKVWMAECVSAWEKFLFERRVLDGDWPKVALEFTKDKDVF